MLLVLVGSVASSAAQADVLLKDDNFSAGAGTPADFGWIVAAEGVAGRGWFIGPDQGALIFESGDSAGPWAGSATFSAPIPTAGAEGVTLQIEHSVTGSFVASQFALAVQFPSGDWIVVASGAIDDQPVSEGTPSPATLVRTAVMTVRFPSLLANSVNARLQLQGPAHESGQFMIRSFKTVLGTPARPEAVLPYAGSGTVEDPWRLRLHDADGDAVTLEPLLGTPGIVITGSAAGTTPGTLEVTAIAAYDPGSPACLRAHCRARSGALSPEVEFIAPWGGATCPAGWGRDDGASAVVLGYPGRIAMQPKAPELAATPVMRPAGVALASPGPASTTVIIRIDHPVAGDHVPVGVVPMFGRVEPPGALREIVLNGASWPVNDAGEFFGSALHLAEGPSRLTAAGFAADGRPVSVEVDVVGEQPTADEFVGGPCVYAFRDAEAVETVRCEPRRIVFSEPVEGSLTDLDDFIILAVSASSGLGERSVTASFAGLWPDRIAALPLAATTRSSTCRLTPMARRHWTFLSPRSPWSSSFSSFPRRSSLTPLARTARTR